VLHRSSRYVGKYPHLNVIGQVSNTKLSSISDQNRYGSYSTETGLKVYISMDPTSQI